MKLVISSLALLILFSVNAICQIGGNSTYKFLQLPNAARVAALGGNSISIKDNDLNMAFHNPSLLDSSMNKHLVLNYVNYFTDINFGYVSYAKNLSSTTNFAVGLHYINYGNFTEADETGIKLGEFKAAEYALNLIWSKKFTESLYFGANLKPILSNLEKYVSFGATLDLGFTYYSEKRQFSAALVVKNIGTQIKPYYKGNYEPVPFDIQLGVSKKLSHAPFRISILAHDLHKIDLTYTNPEKEKESIDPFTNEVKETNKGKEIADKIGRHLIFSVEALLGKNFHFDVSYNHQRRKELSLETRSGIVGFAWGFGFKVSKFHISYGRASYHLAAASNHFSITTNLSEFYKRKEN